MANKKPEISLRITSGGIEKVISLTDIMAKYQFPFTHEVTTVQLEMKHNDNTLIASASADEADYPGFNIDAKDKNGRSIYLANVELPNETFPDAIGTRLYAGYADFETDTPIALTKTVLRENEEVDRLDEITSSQRGLQKYVHVDYDAATVKNWKTNEGLEEHVEEF